ncbi:hypothetical protein ACI8AG_09600 [Blastococcus sp. SYSU DS0552]
MSTHPLNENDDTQAHEEMLAAMPAVAKLGAMVAAVIEDALADALDGRRKQSCLHLVDAANGWRTDTGPLRPGQRRPLDRMAFLCVQHPDRLLCDEGASPGVSLGCANLHMAQEHRDEMPARCFTCEQPIPEDEITPVFAAIQLHRPLTVYNSSPSDFQYLGTLHTLPITYLCLRHAAQVDLPIRMAWPLTAEGITPEDVIQG